MRRKQRGLLARRVWQSSRVRWLFVGLMVGSVIVQLLYPWDRAFLGATVDGRSVTFRTREDIQQMLVARYQQATIEVKDIGMKTAFADAGISPNTRMAAEVAVAWPWWQRLIPFSSVYRGLTNHQRASLQQNTAAQSAWAQLVVAACNKPASNAGVTVSATGQLQVKPAADGRSCEAKTILKQLWQTSLVPAIVVDVQPTVLKPVRTDAQVETVLTEIRPILYKGISVRANDKVTTADAKTIAGWLTFTDGDKGVLVVDVDLAKMQDFINTAQSSVYIAPGTTIIHKVDGVETGREAGISGQGIDQKQLAADIQTIFKMRSNQQLVAKIVALPPKESVLNSYSDSIAGLQSLLNQLVKDKGDVAIAVTELGGQGRSLTANGSKQYHPASTYKLVIAYSVIKRVEAGSMKWSDQINGKSVDDCLTTMIVDSDNACAEAFGETIGWGAVQSDLRSIGMSSTNYQSTDFVSTVTDQALFLTKLERGQLMKNENKDKLIALMKRQRYRSGIPAGVSASVADKVGFLGGLLHDSAIVYAPGGTYVIVVYSNGGTWGNIADIARQVDVLIR